MTKPHNHMSAGSVDILRKFADAYRSGAQGADIEYDIAQKMALAIDDMLAPAQQAPQSAIDRLVKVHKDEMKALGQLQAERADSLSTNWQGGKVAGISTAIMELKALAAQPPAAPVMTITEMASYHNGQEPAAPVEPADCTHRIAVTPRNGAPHGAGFACGLTGGHCIAKAGCGYEPHAHSSAGNAGVLDKIEQRLNESGTGEMGLLDTIHAVAAIVREARRAIPVEPQGSSKWQPIETAPKIPKGCSSAKPFLAWCPDATAPDGGDQRIVWWEPNLKGGCWWSDRDLKESPTLWKPLGISPFSPQGGK